jgi:hypothetical protein
MSQWTVTLITVGLIAVSVLAISPLKLNFSPPYVAVMQIIFSVLILAYTLLLSLGDYSLRSVKIHRCGMELGKIAREIKLYLGNAGNEEIYKEFVNSYYECLEKYENHEACEYLEAVWLAEGKRGKLTAMLGWAKDIAKFYVTRYLPTAHYFFVLGMVYFWIYFLVK